MFSAKTLAKNALVLTLLTGCGQVATTMPTATQPAGQATLTAERSIMSPILAAKAAIKKQLEVSMPDNGLRFATLDVSSTPLGYVFAFTGTAHITTFFGTDLYAVGGTYNSYTNKAVLTKRERLNVVR